MAFARGRVVIRGDGRDPWTVATEPAALISAVESPDALTMPIEYDGERLGTLHLEPADGAASNEWDQAAIAEAAARLGRELKALQAGAPLGRAALTMALGEEIDHSTLAGEPLRDLAARLAPAVLELIGADRLAIVRYDVERGGVDRLAVTRSFAEPPEPITGAVTVGQLLTSEFAANPRELLLGDLRDAGGATDFGVGIMLEQGLTSGALLPLVFDGRLQGGLVLGGFGPACLRPERLALARDIANRLAVAMAHADARERSGNAIARLEFLREIDAAILASTSTNDLAEIAVKAFRELAGASWAAIGLFDDTLAFGTVIGAWRDGEPTAFPVGVRFPLDGAIPGGWRSAPALTPLPDLAAAAADLPPAQAAVEAGLTVGLVVPLVADGRLVGGATLAGNDPAMVSPESAEVAQEVANRMAVAFVQREGRMRLERARVRLEGLHTLDRLILAETPIKDTADVAVRHVRAVSGAVRVFAIGYNLREGTVELLALDGETPLPQPIPEGRFTPSGDLLREEMQGDLRTRVFTDLAQRRPFGGLGVGAAQDAITASAWVPVIAGDRLEGMLVLAARSPDVFNPETLEVAEEVAAQLGVAIRGARDRETTERTLARLEFVNQASRSVLAAVSVDGIANAAVARVSKLPGVDRAAVIEVNAAAGTVRFIATTDEPGSPMYLVGMVVPLREVLPPSVVEAHEPLFVADVRGTPAMEMPAGRDAVEAGFPAVALVPLVADGVLVGALALGGRDERLVDHAQRTSILEVAAQLAVALAHARSRDALQRALERQELVHEIDTAILSSATAEEIAERVLGPLQRLTGALRLDISAYDLDTDRGRILAFAHDGRGASTPVGTLFRLQDTVPLVAMTDAATTITRDLRDLVDTLPLARHAVEQGLTAGAWVPLLADGRLLGAISLGGDATMHLDDDTIAAAREVGDQVAVALQHRLDRDGLAEGNARLALVNGIGRGILAADGAEAVAAHAVEGLLELAGASRVVVYALEHRRTARVLAFASTSTNRPLAVGDRFADTDVMQADVLEGHRGAIVADVSTLVDRLPGARSAVEAGVRTAIIEPMVAGDELIGCVVVSGGEGLIAAGGNIAATREVAGLLALAIRHAKVQDDLREALERQRLVHQIDAAILAEQSSEALAQQVAEPLRILAGARRLDISAYDMDRDRGRVIAFAHDGTANFGPPKGEFPLRERVPLVDRAMDGPLVMRDLRTLGSSLNPVRQAIADGLFNTLWMPLVAGGRLLGGIGLAGDFDLRIEEVKSGLAREVGDQLAVALLHERDKQELASREARLRTIIEESPNGIVVINERGIIGLANPAAHDMFLAPSGSLVGQTIGVFVPTASHEPDSEAIAVWFREPSLGRTHPMDTEAKRADGSMIPVHVLLAPVDTPEGRIAIATIVDLSERTELEARLRQSERLEVLGQFAGVLAHDVRNHLAAVTWSAELMAAELAPDSPHREDVEIIRTATRDAISMTKSVLEYARPSGDVKGSIDVAAHLEGLSRMVKRVLGDGISLELDADPDLPKAGIDGTALTQVIVNLASNAKDAMPSGGTFRVRARLHPGLASGAEQQIQTVPHIHIEVSDTGLGMDEATRQRAFEAFYTTKGAASEQRGTGLGLSSVFLIVNRAGGGIRVESTPGEGTMFTVDLPIAGGRSA